MSTSRVVGVDQLVLSLTFPHSLNGVDVGGDGAGAGQQAVAAAVRQPRPAEREPRPGAGGGQPLLLIRGQQAGPQARQVHRAQTLVLCGKTS